MLKTLVLCMLCTITACGATSETPEAPYVRLVVQDAPQDHAYVQAVSAWAPLGFEVGFEDSGMVECDFTWPSETTDCQITIGIIRDPLLREKEGTNALSDRTGRFMKIDSEVTDPFGLAIAVAHEAGHILLDTAEHTQGGIMGGADCVMHDVDKELACRTIGICI